MHLSGLVYVVDAARQLFFAEVVDQPGVFLFGEPHPSMRAVLMVGDLGAVIFGGVILRRYGRTLIVARSQVLAETIVLDLANLAQQRLVELFGRRPVVSTPVKDQQLLGLRAVPNDIVRAIQAFQQAFHGIVVVPCLVGNLLDADLVTAAEIGVRIGHAVEIDVPILGRKVIDDLAVRPKVHADIPIARHSFHLLRWAVARFPGRPYQNGSSPSSSLTSAKSPP